MLSFVRRGAILLYVAAILSQIVVLNAQENHDVLARGGSTIVLEPYAPNILRVTLSLKRDPALAAPGYGIVAAPAADGWSASQTAQADLYQSARIVATVDNDRLPPIRRSSRSWTLPGTLTVPLPARTSRCARPRARRCLK